MISLTDLGKENVFIIILIYNIFTATPVAKIINKLKNWNEIVAVAVTFPVALSLDQRLLDLRYQGFVSLNYSLQLLGLLLLFVRSSLLWEGQRSSV